MACKLVPSFLATEGISNITAIAERHITITTAVGILQETTAAAVAPAADRAAAMEEEEAGVDQLVPLIWFNIKDMRRCCITLMLRFSNLGEEASSRPEQYHSLEGPSELGTESSRLPNSSRVWTYHANDALIKVNLNCYVMWNFRRVKVRWVSAPRSDCLCFRSTGLRPSHVAGACQPVGHKRPAGWDEPTHHSVGYVIRSFPMDWSLLTYMLRRSYSRSLRCLKSPTHIS